MKKHYFLLATLVVYQKDKLERNKPLNILVTSDEQFVTRSQLGRAQQQAQVRFFTEFDTERKSQVTDVFVQSVSYLGEMTEQEFHGEFYVDPNAEAAPAPETAEDVPAEASTDVQVQAEAPATEADNSDPRYGTDDANKQAQDRGE